MLQTPSVRRTGFFIIIQRSITPRSIYFRIFANLSNLTKKVQYKFCVFYSVRPVPGMVLL
jgi:hypothetical protein